MKFIEFTTPSGKDVLVNASLIRYVKNNASNIPEIHFDTKDKIEVRGTYDSVVRRLTEPTTQK